MSNQRHTAGRKRTARLQPSDYDFEVFVDYRKPKTEAALEARAAINRTESFRVLARATSADESAIAEAAAHEVGSRESDVEMAEAMADLAVLCSAAITDVRTEHGSLAWEDYADRVWTDLDEDEREQCAAENPDLCIWSIALLLSRGASMTALGESSAPRSTATPRG